MQLKILQIFSSNNTETTIDDLKPFTLYQFKVRTLDIKNNHSSAFGDTVECYSKEDCEYLVEKNFIENKKIVTSSVAGKVEDIEWFLVNGSTARIAWKGPKKMSGVIQKYLVLYTTDATEPISTWNSIETSGNKTSATLPVSVSGKRYFVQVQAYTNAGYGKLSDRVIIVAGGNMGSKIPSSSDEQKPAVFPKPDESLGKFEDETCFCNGLNLEILLRKILLILGIVLGVVISIVFITICLCSMYCRRKFENSRLIRDSEQTLKGRALMRNGNGYCIEQTSTSVSQYNVTANSACNEIELSVLCPATPLTSDAHRDAKGGINEAVESCIQEPLLWPVNGDMKGLCIHDKSQVISWRSGIMPA